MQSRDSRAVSGRASDNGELGLYEFAVVGVIFAAYFRPDVETTGGPLSLGERGLWRQAELSPVFSSPIKGVWNFAPFPVPIVISYLLFDFFAFAIEMVC
jgi:hypothetical protein